MRSFRDRNDPKRKVFLAFSGAVGSQLRDQFAKKNAQGLVTQASLAAKLGVNRSVINRRLTGQCNMTEETISDMVWALGCCIKVDIFDPAERPEINHPLAPETQATTIDGMYMRAEPVRRSVTSARTAQTTMTKLQMAQ